MLSCPTLGEYARLNDVSQFKERFLASGFGSERLYDVILTIKNIFRLLDLIVCISHSNLG